MTIMIVDDEKLIRTDFKNISNLSFRNINIIYESSNGKYPLENLNIFSPNILLTDIKTSNIDSITLTKKLKELYPHITVIVLSNYSDCDYTYDTINTIASYSNFKASMDIANLCNALNRLSNSKTKVITENIESESSFIPNIDIDKSKIKLYLELQQFDNLKEYIFSILDSSSQLPVPYLQDILRELFFFMKYTLDSLGFSNNNFKNNKYMNSYEINSITLLNDALNWIDSTINYISNYCTSHKSKHAKIIDNIIEFIENNYTTNISLSNIADKFFINKNYLCDIFKAETNTTINEYISNLRIDKSKSLIRDTNMTISEISYTIGYNSINYFNRVFRKKTGISPSEYTKLYR